VSSMLELVAPPPKLTVSEYADIERRLSSESSSQPGIWRTFPYQKEMMDALNDPRIRKVVLMTGSQLGKTECLNNIILYYIAHNPSPVLMVQPTLDMAESYSKDRLAPMIRDTPSLSKRIKDPRSRDSENTLLHKRFPGGWIGIVSPTPSQLCARPVRILLMDEVDRYAHTTEEGDPIRLAEKRQTTFFNRKCIITSTPTVKGRSRIEQEYLASDQRQYYVPCPFEDCNKFQVLRFPRLDWAKGDPSTAKYRCEHCSRLIPEVKKFEMLKKGQWIAGATSRGIAGFHINELYSTFSPWEKLANDFLSAKTPETLRVFINTSLGETWEEDGESLDPQELFKTRREPYKLNTVPAGGIILIAACDVQRDRLECEIKAFGENKAECWSIDYRVWMGTPSDPTDPVWKNLDGILNEQWELSSGVHVGIDMLGIDTSFSTSTVYQWCRSHHNPARIMPIRGMDSLKIPIGQPTGVDVNQRGKKVRGLKVWPVGVSVLKNEIMSRIQIGKGQPGSMHFPEYDLEYFKQLCSEKYSRSVNRKGFPSYAWTKVYERNEVFDLAVYNYACYIALGCLRWTHERWQQEKEARGLSVPELKKQKQPSKPKVKKLFK